MNYAPAIRRPLEGERFQVIVIGGGINGVAIARECARAGRRTLLIEQHDFAAGTTSRATRIIHGGLRYLEHAEIGLVRESLLERRRLLQQHPHLVHPVHFLLALDQEQRAQRSDYAHWPVALYAAWGAAGCRLTPAMKMSTSWSACSTPAGAGRFSATRTRSASFLSDWWRSGWSKPWKPAPSLAITPRCWPWMSATGVWPACFCATRSPGKRSASKAPGSSMPPAPGQTGCASVPGSRRLNPWLAGFVARISCCRALPARPTPRCTPRPWTSARFLLSPGTNRYWSGTTEVADQGDPGKVQPAQEEIDYLVRSLLHLFPRIKLTASDIRYTFAGVRPLAICAQGKSRGSDAQAHTP